MGAKRKKAPKKGAPPRPRKRDFSLSNLLNLGNLPFQRLELQPDQLEADRQMRQTFEDTNLIRLADSLLAVQINDCLVNEEFDQQGNHRRYRIIAGESRWRASKINATRGETIPLACKVYHNLSEEQCLALQIMENVHFAVPLHETAEAIYRLYLKVKRLAPDCPKTEFVHWLGIGVGKLNESIAFCTMLDKRVTGWVKSGQLSYGAAVLISTLPKSFVTPEGPTIYPQIQVASHAIDNHLLLPGVEKQVRLMHKKLGGQIDLVDLWGEAQASDEKGYCNNNASLALLTREAGAAMHHVRTLITRHEEGRTLSTAQARVMREGCANYVRLSTILRDGELPPEILSVLDLGKIITEALRQNPDLIAEILAQEAEEAMENLY